MTVERHVDVHLVQINCSLNSPWDADMANGGITRKRPRQVTVAVWLILITIIVNFPMTIAWNILYLRESETNPLAVLCWGGLTLFDLFFSIFISVKIFQGRNWARLLFISFFVLSLVSDIFCQSTVTCNSQLARLLPLFMGLGYSLYFFQLVAIGLLIGGEAGKFFREKQPISPSPST